jgi:hypothetical protein
MNKIDRLAMIRKAFNRSVEAIGVLPITAVEIKEETEKARNHAYGSRIVRNNLRNDSFDNEIDCTIPGMSQIRFDIPSVPTERETDILLSREEKRSLSREICRSVVSVVNQSNPVEITENETDSIFPAQDVEEFQSVFSPEIERYARAAVAFETDCENLPLRLMA